MADTETKNLSAQINAFATRVGTEVKAVKGRVTTAEGKISTLETTVAGIQTTIESKSEINDEVVATTSTYSSSKIASEITAAKQAVKNDLLDGAGAAYDTLKELGALIDTNKNAIDALEAVAANHVVFDKAQELTDEQKAFARGNIGAASAAEVTTLSGKVTANETALAGKASQADLDTANGKITANEAAIALKASQADLTALEAKVGNVETDFVATFEAALA